MPYINLRVVGKLSREQKQIIAKEFSDTLLRVAKKPKETTYLVIDEVDGANWAQGEKFFKCAQITYSCLPVGSRKLSARISAEGGSASGGYSVASQKISRENF